jgi:hypothetical protein
MPALKPDHTNASVSDISVSKNEECPSAATAQAELRATTEIELKRRFFIKSRHVKL